MTTDLKDKPVDYLIEHVDSGLLEYSAPAARELARRLKEAQLAVARLAALAKAEVLEEVLEGMDDGDILDLGWLRELAAEYRGKKKPTDDYQIQIMHSWSKSDSLT